MNRKTSAYISLIICILSAVILTVLLFRFPSFINWMLEQDSTVNCNFDQSVRSLSIAFYAASPISFLAIYLLIRLLLNVTHDKVFIDANVKYLRCISYCCHAVALICLVYVFLCRPFFKSISFVAFAMAVVGSLIRVVKNVMQSAVELQQENDLTI
ncbi:MAG: DUF2975 domain-containing protein [Clostridia bacterium]|nr:DUF2975 domain-containing protein [Clostridia bacterium]